uniref:Uncharacterized protein n=1 Tax=Atrato Virga-like virus 7 TaxID=2689346 RepID=A0A6B9KNM1_9VIRU|nr:hypothetical protein [Atrato Virga-like virus 7]
MSSVLQFIFTLSYLLVVLNLTLLVETAPINNNETSLGNCESNFNFYKLTPTYKMLVQYGRLDFSTECFRATIGKTCNLPNQCHSVTSYHLTIDNKFILICIGYLGDTTSLRKLQFYPIASLTSIVPQNLYFVVVETLDDKFEHAFILPENLVSAFAYHPINSHDFYVNTNFKVCKRGDMLTAISPFVKRRLTMNNGLIQNYILDHKHLPFVCETTNKFVCADIKLHLKDNFKKSACRSLLIVNNTHALCSHVWVQYPDKLCPTDYKYRTGMYTYPEICTSITESDESKLKVEGNWLTRALVAVVDWVFKAAEKFIDFLEGCLSIVLERVGELILKQLLLLEEIIEDWDDKFLLFELLVINFYIVYKSNCTAAILFTLIFGILVGYNRQNIGISFRVLSIVRSIANSTLF